ncbi:GNAT family N-acetyltransferase [Silvanigrella paludirubra]|uniref:GNAT family N-acetyltransferase n=1 Tax=Silvanigrella paludirubra TaxID=2499159 RepID=A0A6N6VUK5_9BACT|nr:GNAT family protein [Silvanigrella paludirubra]KAB8039873.1 GNAT family N-acetyltransferase [Silvanigrella paludirubra]
MIENKSNLLLRVGSLIDYEILYDIYMDDKNNRYLNFEITSKTNFKSLFNEILSNGILYILEINSKIISTCIITKKKRRTSHIAILGNLATSSDFKGKGYSYYFIELLIFSLKEEGIKRIELFVESDNFIALSFYLKLGFKIEGRLEKYFKRENEKDYIDEYIMAKIIK